MGQKAKQDNRLGRRVRKQTVLKKHRQTLMSSAFQVLLKLIQLKKPINDICLIDTNNIYTMLNNVQLMYVHCTTVTNYHYGVAPLV